MKINQFTKEIFFLKNHTQNVGEKLVPDLFIKSQNQAYFWINNLKCYTVCFLLYAQVEIYQNRLKLKCRPLAFNLNKGSLKSKEVWI